MLKEPWTSSSLFLLWLHWLWNVMSLKNSNCMGEGRMLLSIPYIHTVFISWVKGANPQVNEVCSLKSEWRWQYTFLSILPSPAEQYSPPSPFWSAELFSKNQKPLNSIPFLKRRIPLCSCKCHWPQQAPLSAKRSRFLLASLLAH